MLLLIKHVHRGAAESEFFPLYFAKPMGCVVAECSRLGGLRQLLAYYLMKSKKSNSWNNKNFVFFPLNSLKLLSVNEGTPKGLPPKSGDTGQPRSGPASNPHKNVQQKRTCGHGQKAPIPPVLGPASPFNNRLWSWAGGMTEICSPSLKHSTETSSPSKRSSITIWEPASPNFLSLKIRSFLNRG